MKKTNLNEQLQRIREMMEIPSDDLGEGEFSKVATTLRGLRPAIKTIAIITAENPMSQKATPEFNKEANEDLRDTLSSGLYGFRQIKGKYGSLENPFLINNISRDSAIDFGAQYNQESIVFGEVENEDDYVGMKFQLINTKKGEENGLVIGERRVYVMLDNPKDFYSEVQGRKFVIPFYDIIDNIKKDGEKFERIRDYSQSKWEGGKNPPTSTDLNKIEEELTRIVDTMSSTMGSTAYNYRGMYRDRLKKYGLL